MMMMGIHFMGEVPFKDVYIHALVRDATGAKMSKSKGNVIDPLALIDQYGADALRFTLTAMAAQGRDLKLSTQRIEGYRNFATKLWNSARFAGMNGCVRVADFDPRSPKEALNRWIIGATARAAGEITSAIETYRFNDAANTAYRFVWNIFCDWYVELTKPTLLLGKTVRDAAALALPDAQQNVLVAEANYRFEIENYSNPDFWRATAARFAVDSDEHKLINAAADVVKKTGDIGLVMRAEEEMRATTAFVLDEILKLLHPFMPFLTEEIWALKGAEGPARTDLLTLTPWPDLAGLEDASAEAEVGWVVDLGSEIRSLRTEMSVPGAAQIPLVLVGADAGVQARAQKWGETVSRLARLSGVTTAASAPENSVQLLVRDSVAALPLAGIIDLAAEAARLEREVAKCKAEIGKVDAKLANPDFVARAPEDILDEHRERREDFVAKLERMLAALARLKG